MLHAPPMQTRKLNRFVRDELLCGGFSTHLCLNASNSLPSNTASRDPLTPVPVPDLHFPRRKYYLLVNLGAPDQKGTTSVILEVYDLRRSKVFCSFT